MSKEKITGYSVSWASKNRGNLLLNVEGLEKFALEIRSKREMSALTNQLSNQPHCYFDTIERTLIFTTEPI